MCSTKFRRKKSPLDQFQVAYNKPINIFQVSVASWVRFISNYQWTSENLESPCKNQDRHSTFTRSQPHLSSSCCKVSTLWAQGSESVVIDIKAMTLGSAGPFASPRLRVFGSQVFSVNDLPGIPKPLPTTTNGNVSLREKEHHLQKVPLFWGGYVIVPRVRVRMYCKMEAPANRAIFCIAAVSDTSENWVTVITGVAAQKKNRRNFGGFLWKI